MQRSNKVRRNELCPCGLFGRKYKNCCAIIRKTNVTTPEMVRFLREDNPDLLEKLQQEMTSAPKELGVCCLSAKNDDILM